MRKLLTILVLLCPALAWAGTCGNGYGLSVQIRLRKATGSDLTNFPYPLAGTYTPFKTAANGGQVQNLANNSIGVSGPADMVICDAASAGNALKYEVAEYSATTGTFEIWVQIPTLHTASYDFVWIFVNNPSVVTTQQDLTLWGDANYSAVYHMPNGSTLSAKDSTGAHNGTINGTASASAGFIGGAETSTASTANVSTSYMPANTNVTLEMWVRRRTSGTASASFYVGNSASNGFGFVLEDQAGTCGSGTSVAVLLGGTGGAGCNATSGPWPLAVNTWGYAVLTRAAGAWSLYGNGALISSASLAPIASTGSTIIGRDEGSQTSDFDEVRIATVQQSANWINTSFNVVYYPGFQIVGQTFSTPTIVNIGSCASNTIGGSMSCVMPFPVTSGGYLVLANAHNGSGVCTGSVTSDTLGLTWTNHISEHVTGVTDGYSCVYSAPITVAGAETITLPVGQAAWTLAYEVKSITSVGIATTSTTSNQPTTMTATAPTNNSFLLCTTISPTAVLATSTTPSTYTLRSISGFDPSNGYRFINAANGVVASGSQSCSFNTGSGGTLAIFGLSAPTTKRRPSQVY